MRSQWAVCTYLPVVVLAMVLGCETPDRPRSPIDLGLAADMAESGRNLLVHWQKRHEDDDPGVAPDTVRVERRLRAIGSDPGRWRVVFEDSADVTHFHDFDLAGWVDGAILEYRVCFLAGGHTGDAVSVESWGGQPLTPTATARFQDGAVVLEWTYPGRAQVSFQIGKISSGGSWAEVASVEGGVTEYSEVSPTPGLWRYQVFASLPGGRWDLPTVEGLISDAVALEVLVPNDGLASHLGTRVLHMPVANDAARAPDGSFALIRTGEPFAELVEEDGSWLAWTGLESGAAENRVAVDGAGRAHFYSVAYDRTEAVWRAIHRWREAGAWHTDSPRDALLDGQWGGGLLGPGGQPQTFLRDRPASGASPVLSWYVRGASDWSGSPLPPPWDATMPPGSWAVDPDGQPGFISARDDGLLLVRHGPSGWRSEEIPLPAGKTWVVTRLLIPAADHVVVVAGASTDLVGVPKSFYVVERDAAGWKDAQLLPTAEGAGNPGTRTPTSWAAASSDGNRIAVVLGLQLALRDEGGWRMLDLIPLWAVSTVGFTADGRLWVLQGLSPDDFTADEEAPYIVYAEP